MHAAVTDSPGLLDFDEWLDAANDRNIDPFICLKDIIEARLKHGHCEIHLQQEADICRVRSRIQGKLDELRITSESMLPELLAQLHAATGAPYQHQLGGEVITATRIAGRQCRLEASYFPTALGCSLTLTITRIDAIPETLDQLPIAAHTIDAIRRHYQSTARGITLVCGRNIEQLHMLYYALLGESNTLEEKVISLERFVTKPFPRINQIRMTNETSHIAEFATRHADRIFVDCTGTSQATYVNELIAMRQPASLLLCASDSADAIRQLLDSGINEHDLAPAIAAIIEIGDASAICPHCADSYQPGTAELLRLEQHSVITKAAVMDVFVDASGCTKCAHSGRAETIMCASLCKRTDAISSAINSRSTDRIQGALQQSLGKQSVEYQLEALVRSGKSSFTEFLKR